MKKKANSLFLSLALTVVTGAIALQPVSASGFTRENRNESRNPFKTLISQLRGHNTYAGDAQIEWGDYRLGRVVGKTGGIIFIKVEDGVSFTAAGSVSPGSDVLVLKGNDGRYSFVQGSEAEWISVLMRKHGYKKIDGSLVSLNERTASIWREIESSRRTVTEIPPRQTTVIEQRQTEVMEFRPEPQPQRIRGLW